MATLKLPSVESATSASVTDKSPLQSPTIPPDSSIKAALTTLLEGLEYSRQLGAAPWDFAVEVSCLRRLKLSNNDLRWLLAHDLVEHAIEVVADGQTRSFRKQAPTTIGKRSCFVLTEAGAELAREVRGDVETNPHDRQRAPRDRASHRDSARPAPCWDRNRRELWFGDTLIKRFTLPAPDQESILTAFEEQHWPARIDDPSLTARDSARGGKLLETVQQLNNRHRSSLIRFQCDGNRGVIWQHGETPAKQLSQPLPAVASGA